MPKRFIIMLLIFDSANRKQQFGQYYLITVAETVFVIPAKAGIQFFALEPCFRRGDIVGFCFPQQELFWDTFANLAGLLNLLRRQFHFVCEGLTNADQLTCFVRVLLDPFLEVL